jgi:hypothetical protein
LYGCPVFTLVLDRGAVLNVKHSAQADPGKYIGASKRTLALMSTVRLSGIEVFRADKLDSTRFLTGWISN